MNNDLVMESTFSACDLDADTLLLMARRTGFWRREPRKIKLKPLLESVCQESVRGTVSYNDVAGSMHATTGVCASRQAYWERMKGEPCVEFFKAVLAHSMIQKHDAHAIAQLKSCGLFTRILVQDSTIIRLPARLFESFSGVKNAHTTTCNARIQGTYDLCSGQFISFSIDPYSKNDVSVAADIQARPGDLVLRDRGYFLVDLIKELKDKGIDTISRYKHVTLLYDVLTRQKIDLLDLLTRQGSVDQVFLAGREMNVRVRLMAVPVKEEIANLRRMKAKKEMKGHAPSEDLLRLMSWSIFIVSLEAPALTIAHVLAIYGLRWRIENIFKTWKSNFSFDKLHNVSANQLRVLLIARLIMICLCYHRAFVPLCPEVLRHGPRPLSLMKFMRFITRNLTLLPQILHRHRWTPRLLEAIARYCTYEKRHRQHFVAHMDAIFTDLQDLQALA